MSRTYIVLLALAQLLLFSLECQEDIEKKVRQYLGWMNRESEDEVWLATLRLEELGIAAVPVLKREVRTLPEVARVACAKVLINLGETDYGIELLLEIVKNGTVLKAKITAASLIGIHGDFELEDRLNELLESAYEPRLKIALAKALWQVARSPQAGMVLKSFLSVENVNIQYEAALALAETNNVEAAKPVLSKLKEEPTLRGRLARAFLEQDSLINRYEKMLDSQGAAQSEYKVIEEVVTKIKQYHVSGEEFSTGELVNAAVKGIVLHCDIHSAFWTEEDWKDFIDHVVEEEYVGIGVYVGERNGSFIVIAPIYSGPAYRVGIRSMDQIIEVNGWPTIGRTLDELLAKIRGEQGNSIRLKIFRAGWMKEREIDVPREKIQIPSVFYEMLPGKIGYLRLTQFGSKATENMELALKDMEANGMKGLILDLRGNAGGWLKTAVDIVDMFLTGGQLIVYSEGRHPIKGQKYSYYSTNSNPHPHYPIVLLVDEASASASEIVAGTLQYYKRAIIVGTQTFGKGSVQEPLELDTRPGARLKLTIAHYYLPDGRCIHNLMDKSGTVIKHNGIAPDIAVVHEKGEPWKNEELARLEEQKRFQEYLDRYYEANKSLFFKIAENDDLESGIYPGFDLWYQTLNTKASPADVRGWLRMQLRRRVADERAREYACDYVEDVVLQRAIFEVCRKLGIASEGIQEYKVFVKKFENK